MADDEQVPKVTPRRRILKAAQAVTDPGADVRQLVLTTAATAEVQAPSQALAPTEQELKVMRAKSDAEARARAEASKRGNPSAGAAGDGPRQEQAVTASLPTAALSEIAELRAQHIEMGVLMTALASEVTRLERIEMPKTFAESQANAQSLFDQIRALVEHGQRVTVMTPQKSRTLASRLRTGASVTAMAALATLVLVLFYRLCLEG